MFKKNTVKKIVLFFCGFISILAHAELPISVADALKKSAVPQDSVAIYVQAVDSATPLITYNSAKSFNPASVMKLVTTNAALDLLTPAYRWKTEIYRDGELQNGVLNGNLIIKGYGDPSFKPQDFWRLLMRLQQVGMREIKGDLIIDKTFFAKNVGATKAIDIGNFDNEKWRAYNAEPSAFLVNGRNTSFKFVAADNVINISQEFELPEIQIVNNMRVSQSTCGEWRNQFGYTVKQFSNKAVVTFNGTFAPDCGERYLELSVFNDEQYAFYTFNKLWRELGGVFNGQLKVQELPNASIKVFEQLSDPLGYVVRDINKWSNNVMARQLLLTLGAEKQGLPATEAKGAIVVKNWLLLKGIDAKELVIENGSGLSRIERISSEHLGQLLMSAFHSAVMPDLMASLPILGVDGTAMKRLKTSPSAGKVHLKTGSLDNVSAIAGYVLNAQNKRYVLVMIVNNNKAAASKAAQDALIEWVYNH